MRQWGIRLGFILAAALLAVITAMAGARMLTSRDSPAVEQEALRAHYQKSLEWVRANESVVLEEGNSALWWMILTAARRTDDSYLFALVDKAILRHYPESLPFAWKRMLDPKAPLGRASRIVHHDLAPYQQFFYHALSCLPIAMSAGGDTTVFLERNMCTPQLSKVFMKDPVCTTHQVMGLQVYRQTGCPLDTSLAPLEAELLDDVEFQLTWDPIVRDPYYQRLLILAWNGRADRIQLHWMHRFLDAQEADGGWLGHRRIPELPTWAQPWHWREKIAQRWPQVFPPEFRPKDFHATAQAILLMALLLPAEPPRP